MRQVLQPISGGPVEVAEVPRPTAGPTEVLVRTVASVISPGTERAVTSLAQASLLAKARARPDLVRQVIQKARTEGIAATAQTVRSRLAEDLPLGYSAPGSGAQLCESQAGSETAGAEMSAEPACRPATTAAGAFDTSVATPTGQFDVTITAPGTAKLAVETGPVAAGFQVTTQAPVLTCHVSGSLPIQVSTRWRRASGQPAAARPARHVPAPEESDRDHDA